MNQTFAQATRAQKLSERSERLAQHSVNCQALTAAYARRRRRSLRAIRFEIDALLRAEPVAAALWSADFNADRFLDTLPIDCKRRYYLS